MTERHRRTVKAYQNDAFLNSRKGRPLRILAEYFEPESRFEHHQVRDTIVFFGSARFVSREQAEKDLAAARAGNGDLALAERRHRMADYYEAARELAHRLTQWSKSLKGQGRRFVVCTGGGPGIMEAANRGASEAKGLNIGLTISLPVEEFENPYVTRELAFEFHYFFMRKFWFVYMAKAVIIMPGGFGTLDELFEIMTLIQTLKVKRKVPIVLFGTAFWEKVLNLEALVEHGTINAKDLSLFHRTDSVDDAYTFVTEALSAEAQTDPGHVA